jgi:ABC-2 type transport system permease protein
MTAAARARDAVGPSTTLALSYGLLLRLMARRARLIGLGLLGLVIVVAGWAVGRAVDDVDRAEAGVQIISNLGLGVLIPVVALVFASASLGDLREDRTLVYLWLRPMDRWPVVVAAAAASVTIAAPLTLVPTALGAALTGAGGTLVVAAVASGLLAVVTYSAVFVLVGLVLRRALVWGLLYVLIWEGFVALAGAGAARVAIRAYTRSLLSHIADVDLDTLTMPPAVAVIVPLAVSAVAILVASRRLDRMDID